MQHGTEKEQRIGGGNKQKRFFCSTGEAKAEVTLYISEDAAGLLRINTDAFMILSSTLEGAAF